MFEQLSREPLYKGIVDQITQSIITGQMRPGDQLPSETDLANSFGVSRTVVREAVKALSSQGLVEVTHGRGTFVTQPSMDNIVSSLKLILSIDDHSFDDLVEARRLLEIPIALYGNLAICMRPTVFCPHCLEGQRDSFDDATAYMKHDVCFHTELAMATQNTVLSVLIQPLFMMLGASRPILVSVPGKAQRSLDAHQRILDAIESRNGSAAEDAMRSHIDQLAVDRERARMALQPVTTNQY